MHLSHWMHGVVEEHQVLEIATPHFQCFSSFHFRYLKPLEMEYVAVLFHRWTGKWLTFHGSVQTFHYTTLSDLDARGIMWGVRGLEWQKHLGRICCKLRDSWTVVRTCAVYRFDSGGKNRHIMAHQNVLEREVNSSVQVTNKTQSSQSLSFTMLTVTTCNYPSYLKLAQLSSHHYHTWEKTIQFEHVLMRMAKVGLKPTTVS